MVALPDHPARKEDRIPDTGLQPVAVGFLLCLGKDQTVRTDLTGSLDEGIITKVISCRRSMSGCYRLCDQTQCGCEMNTQNVPSDNDKARNHTERTQIVELVAQNPPRSKLPVDTRLF